MTLPTPSVSTFGKVILRAAVVRGDGTDSDSNPDYIAAAGTKVTFTPSVTPIRILEPDFPLTAWQESVVAFVDSDGVLRDSQGNEGVWLLATDNVDTDPVNWVWRVKIQSPGSKKAVTFPLDVIGGEVHDLTLVTPSQTTVTTSGYTPTVVQQVYTARDEAIAAALRAETSEGIPGPQGPAGPAGPAGAGSATLEQVKGALTLGGRLFVVFPNTFWVDWKHVGVTIPEPVPTTMPTGAEAFGFIGGDIAWVIPNEDYTQITIGGDAHGGWEYTLPTGVVPMGVFGGVAYMIDPNTGEWYWTDGTAAPALITGGTLSLAGVLMQGWFIDAGGDWYRVDTTTGAWIITTPPTGVDPQYAYPNIETSDTLVWDGTGWHHLSPAGVWTAVASGPTNPLPYTGGVTYTDTETWVGDSTPGNGSWWSPGDGWRTDHRNYPYTQMWGLADGAVWTDGTDYWWSTPDGWSLRQAPNPLLGFDMFAGNHDRVVGFNSQEGYWGYSIHGGPWVLGLRERIYLLEQSGGSSGATIQDTDYAALLG